MKRNILAWVIAAAIGSFVIAYYSLSYDQMLDVSSAYVTGMWTVVFVLWAMEFIPSLRTGREGWNMMVAAIVGVATTVLAQRGLIVTLRELGRPDWLVYSPASAIIAWMFGTSAVLIILARGTTEGSVPGKSLLWFGVGMFVSGAVFAAGLLWALGDDSAAMLIGTSRVL